MMIELILVVEIIRAVNMVLEILHSQIQRKKIDALIKSYELNQCADCSDKKSNRQLD